MIKPKYQIYKPEDVGSFEEQWKYCVDSFFQYLNNNLDQKAFVARVFIAADNQEQYDNRSKSVKQRMELLKVPFSILSEDPELPSLVMIEAGFVNAENVEVEYGKAESVGFCKLSTSGYNEYWFAGVEGSGDGNTISEKANGAFRRLLSAFLKLGLGFNQIVRQWNYVEQIYEMEQIHSQVRQNYQLFNEARGEYYSRYRTVSDFPAATGIGVDFNGVTIECMVVSNDESLKSIAICNPKQLKSYKYGQEVLKGEPQKNSKQNQPPQFERARLLTNDQTSRLFISGTASIVGQETVGLNDVEKQTYVTIENIGQLVSEVNLRTHYPELTVFPDKYAYVRVYVKNEEDIPAVKVICETHFGQVPMTFVKADICRADLLVEIEAEMIS
jgi:enamine deaminase RidA (YjgF/YER057c/UK114 family)